MYKTDAVAFGSDTRMQGEKKKNGIHFPEDAGTEMLQGMCVLRWSSRGVEATLLSSNVAVDVQGVLVQNGEKVERKRIGRGREIRRK